MIGGYRGTTDSDKISIYNWHREEWREGPRLSNYFFNYTILTTCTSPGGGNVQQLLLSITVSNFVNSLKSNYYNFKCLLRLSRTHFFGLYLDNQVVSWLRVLNLGGVVEALVGQSDSHNSH